MRPPSLSRRAGFTIIEVLISLGVLASLLLISLRVGTSSSSAYRQATTGAQLSAEAKLTVDRVAMELQMASVGTFFPDLDAGGVRNTSSLTFQQLVDIVGAAPVYGGPTPGEVMQLDLRLSAGEADDGLDNDGDGLVDERSLVLVRDLGAASELEVTLCANVTERLEGEDGLPDGEDDNGNGLVDEAGFDIARNGDVLTIRLSVAGTDFRGQTMVRTAETAVRLRN
jgi:prepilin-type N-terminal cleavage/methylation domain-containing protein